MSCTLEEVCALWVLLVYLFIHFLEFLGFQIFKEYEKAIFCKSPKTVCPSHNIDTSSVGTIERYKTGKGQIKYHIAGLSYYTRQKSSEIQEKIISTIEFVLSNLLLYVEVICYMKCFPLKAHDLLVKMKEWQTTKLDIFFFFFFM